MESATGTHTDLTSSSRTAARKCLHAPALPFAPPPPSPVHCIHVCACSQERIEASGPLGSAPTTNPHLDIVESELTAAAAQGVSDGFTTYLCALLEIER